MSDFCEWSSGVSHQHRQYQRSHAHAQAVRDDPVQTAVVGTRVLGVGVGTHHGEPGRRDIGLEPREDFIDVQEEPVLGVERVQVLLRLDVPSVELHRHDMQVQMPVPGLSASPLLYPRAQEQDGGMVWTRKVETAHTGGA